MHTHEPQQDRKRRRSLDRHLASRAPRPPTPKTPTLSPSLRLQAYKTCSLARKIILSFPLGLPRLPSGVTGSSLTLVGLPGPVTLLPSAGRAPPSRLQTASQSPTGSYWSQNFLVHTKRSRLSCCILHMTSDGTGIISLMRCFVNVCRPSMLSAGTRATVASALPAPGRKTPVACPQ